MFPLRALFMGTRDFTRDFFVEFVEFVVFGGGAAYLTSRQGHAE